MGDNETTPLLSDSVLRGFTKPSESRISETVSVEITPLYTTYIVSMRCVDVHWEREKTHKMETVKIK